MKKFTPNGAAIKKIRGQLERLSTQKEFAHEIGVSERTLLQIETENLPVSIITIDRMAKALNVHRRELVFALDSPKIVPSDDSDPLGLIALWNNEQLVPRYDYDLFKECYSSHDVVGDNRHSLVS
jgi:DNA-binding XRE family transcriptional regulator